MSGNNKASVSELIESLSSSPDLSLYPAAQRPGGSRGHSEGATRWQRGSKASRDTAPSPYRGEAGGQGEGCPRITWSEEYKEGQNLGALFTPPRGGAGLVLRLTMYQLASPRYGWILLRN